MAQTKKIKSACGNIKGKRAQDDAFMRSFIRELGDLVRKLKRAEEQTIALDAEIDKIERALQAWRA